jgi:L-fuculose-phosphate aldolase
VSQITGVRFETAFLSKNPPRDKRTDQLVHWCQRFDKLGLAPKSAGNLSFRTKQGFIITATGVELRAAEKANLVEVLKVEILEGQILVYAKGRVVPSKESVLHSEIYNLRPEINAVFHTHDQMVVELADELKLPCTEGEQPRGSYELAQEVQRILRLIEDARYLVLRNHGVIAMGKTMAEAGSLAENMNRMARDFAQRKEGGK